MDDRQFFEFCKLNGDLRIERTAEGDLEIMPPAGGETGNRNAILTHLLTAWALRDDTGVAFDSSTGFNLPNGATRAPDAAWVHRERLAALTAEQKKRFLPLCPDFVVELRSPSDRLTVLQSKMQEYMDNGARLGWLIDAPNLQVYVYRPGAEIERLSRPSSLSGEPELSGFVLDLRAIWETNF
jgi:Uma2 family endonuclease